MLLKLVELQHLLTTYFSFQPKQVGWEEAPGEGLSSKFLPIG